MRKIAQYFYPQRQTQVMNEGWATFWHYTLLNTLYDEGWLTDGVMIEWLSSHTNVIYQPPAGHRAYSGINPYALGFAMYRDIRRICQDPTEEDRRWFPDLAGTPWLPALHHAMQNFKDESFVGQYLSPQLMRDMRLFAIHDDASERELLVSAIHDDDGYRTLRQTLSQQYDLGAREPISRSGTSICAATAASPCATPATRAGRCPTMRWKCSSTQRACGVLACSWKASTAMATRPCCCTRCPLHRPDPPA